MILPKKKTNSNQIDSGPYVAIIFIESKSMELDHLSWKAFSSPAP
jgi:hypothetical protein